MASLGAGAIHAAAIGAHSEHRSVVVTFTLVAVFQLAWGAGALAMRRHARWFLALGVVGSGAAIVGWLLAKTTGIGFISGMEEAEAVQLADASAAFLAAVAGLFSARALLAPGSFARTVQRPLVAVAVIPILVLTTASMLATGSHSHAGGHASDDHAHGGSGNDGHEAAADTGPFDPDDPIDLSGVEGVSADQQAEAEDLLRRSLDRLPQFEDISTLNDLGFYSIGDGGPGGY